MLPSPHSYVFMLRHASFWDVPYLPNALSSLPDLGVAFRRSSNLPPPWVTAFGENPCSEDGFPPPPLKDGYELLCKASDNSDEADVKETPFKNLRVHHPSFLGVAFFIF